MITLALVGCAWGTATDPTAGSTSDGLDCIVAAATTDFSYRVEPADCPLNTNHVPGTCNEAGFSACGEGKPGTGLACCPPDHPFRCGDYCEATNMCGKYCVRCSGSATPFDVDADAQDLLRRLRCTISVTSSRPEEETLYTGHITLTMNQKELLGIIPFDVSKARTASNPLRNSGAQQGFIDVSGDANSQAANLMLDMRNGNGVPLAGETVLAVGIRGLENIAAGDNVWMVGALKIIARPHAVTSSNGNVSGSGRTGTAPTTVPAVSSRTQAIAATTVNDKSGARLRELKPIPIDLGGDACELGR